MICEKCKHDNTHAIDSREKNNTRRRRYECLDCGHRFTTLESYEGTAFFYNGRWGDLDRIETLAENLEDDAAEIVMLARMLLGRRKNKQQRRFSQEEE